MDENSLFVVVIYSFFILLIVWGHFISVLFSGLSCFFFSKIKNTQLIHSSFLFLYIVDMFLKETKTKNINKKSHLLYFCFITVYCCDLTERVCVCMCLLISKIYKTVNNNNSNNIWVVMIFLLKKRNNMYQYTKNDEPHIYI